jgi:transposase
MLVDNGIRQQYVLQRQALAVSPRTTMLQLLPASPIPVDTVRVAQAAIPHGNTYVKLRDFLGVVFDDTLFAPLFPSRGQPAAAPWRLALVTILQFAEDLSDRDAADAVRTRIDWKYLLGLELTDPGFDYSILSRFRERLIEGNAEMLLLQTLLEKCRGLDLVRERSDVRTDSTHIIASIRNMNRLELVGETLRAALNVLATVDPAWLSANVHCDWYLRYAKRFERARLAKSKDGTNAAAEQIGRDGMHLLAAVWQATAPAYLRVLPAVETLRRCWILQFWMEHGVLRWRHAGNLPPSPARIDSPYDLDARFGVKATTEWVGYKVHFTETCSPGAPNLITNVDTTAAHQPDTAHVLRGQEELAKRGLVPKRQLVDGSYVGSHLTLQSRRRHGIELVGPVKQNCHRSQVESGYDFSAFTINWDSQFAICPQGKRSSGWWSSTSSTGCKVIHTKFSRTDCANCVVNVLCTKNAGRNSRKLSLRPREEHELLIATRKEQSTPQWKQLYNRRAGIESTFSQGVRSLGLRRSRYRGLPKCHLQNIAIACAINLQRLGDYWSGVFPAPTRISAFGQLGQYVM